MLSGLPYFPKLVAQEDLTEQEKFQFTENKRRMVLSVATEPSRWAERSDKDDLLVNMVFNTLLGLSIVDVSKLDEFFESDYGRNYGFIWFVIMHRTPTEVGAMSEGDYQAVNSWFRKNHERFEAK